MVFEALYTSWQRGELLLIDGGMCRWHLRRDGQVTILEILSTQPGSGRTMVDTLRTVAGARSLFAKCPSDLPANGFYAALGFVREAESTTPSGRRLLHWRLPLAVAEVPDAA